MCCLAAVASVSASSGLTLNGIRTGYLAITVTGNRCLYYEVMTASQLAKFLVRWEERKK